MNNFDQLKQILLQIPGCVFWKNVDSVFMGGNFQFAKVAGLDSPAQIIGKTDFDLPWGKTHAAFYRAKDREVMAGKNIIRGMETQLQASGKMVTVIVNKYALLDESKKVIGVVGNYDLLMPPENQSDSTAITKQQMLCLNFLCKGYTAKQTARVTNLSPRTIEFYIQTLKKKFDCRNKIELLFKIWKLGLLQEV